MNLELTRIFVKVIQNGSFTKAAETLKLPKSTVSKSIARLERETGTKLIVRSTRSLTVTAAGRSFFESSLSAILQLEEAQKSLYGQDTFLTGKVRITAPEDLGTFVIAPAIAELSQKHPELKFELNYTDEVVDLIKGGFDLAVRIGRTKDSGLKLKRAGEIVLIPVASPRYLKGKEKLKHPKDLSEHSCLSLDIKGIVESWTLRSPRGTVRVPIESKIVCNQMSSVLQMAISGGGVALVPNYLCESHIKSRKLVRVLSDWSAPAMPVSLISPLAPSSSARLKITVDSLSQALEAAFKDELQLNAQAIN